MFGFRRLIERKHAARYVFNMLISFAGAILITRLFLELTGYPQIGGEKLHIAHVLWGGLIVAVGAGLPLVFANRFMLNISAVLSGVGLGLFFDEVGKFLTQDNDYFFRPAASIIYMLFMIGLYVFISVRRGEPDARARLYHALAAMQEVVDGDLDVHEKAELERMLENTIGDAEVPDVKELAGELLRFVQQQADTVPEQPRPLREAIKRAGRWITTNILTRRRAFWLLVASTVLVGVLSMADMATLISTAGRTQQVMALLRDWIAEGNLTNAQESTWFIVMVAIKGIVGLLLITAVVLLLMGREVRGVSFALVGLLLSVTVRNVLLFYFAQFSAVLHVGLDFALILALNFYNNQFLLQHKQA